MGLFLSLSVVYSLFTISQTHDNKLQLIQSALQCNDIHLSDWDFTSEIIKWLCELNKLFLYSFSICNLRILRTGHVIRHSLESELESFIRYSGKEKLELIAIARQINHSQCLLACLCLVVLVLSELIKTGTITNGYYLA